MNDLFGQGFVTLADIGDRIPGDVFAAWAAYVLEYHSDELVAQREAIAKAEREEQEHLDLMRQAAKAAH